MTLLDTLARALKLESLSNLRGRTQRAPLCAAIDLIAPEAHPLAEWEEALFYLTGLRPYTETPAAAKATLLRLLSK